MFQSRFSVIFSVLLLLICHIAVGQKTKPTRILFLVDGSSSMHDTWLNEKSRYTAAQELISAIIDSVNAVNPNVEYGLRVFGAHYPVEKNICYDSRLEVPFARANKDQVKGRLAYIFPKGVSPIAFSLEKAAMEDINDLHYAYSIILVTDGGESCNGSICEVMERVVNYKISFQPYIVSLLDYEPLRKEYECMGKYMIVEDNGDFEPVISAIMNNNNYFKADESTKYIPPVVKTEPVDTPETREPVVTKTDTPEVAHIDTPVITKADTPKITETVVKETEKTYGTVSKISYSGIPKPGFQVMKSIFIYPKVAVQKLKPMVYIEEPEVKTIPEPKKQTAIQPIAVVMPEKHWRMPSLYTIPIEDKIRVRKLPKVNVPEEPIINQPPPKQKIDQDPTVTSVQNENTAEPGTVQIYFTNGKGKYYSSAPKIIIRDLKTNKEVYNDVRGIDMKGNPETLSFPDGTYEVVSVSSGRKADFTIEKGFHKKVEIVVGYGSLSFRYLGTNEAPRNYIAVVSQRFNANFQAVDQPTEIVLTYEASNYHIEINTLPPMILNLVMEFDNNYTVDIPKEGTIQIMNEEDLGRIDFFHKTATSILRFYEMNIYGDTEYQKAKFLPGNYQVKYTIRDPATGQFRNRMKEFNLRSNQNLELTLD